MAAPAPDAGVRAAPAPSEFRHHDDAVAGSRSDVAAGAGRLFDVGNCLRVAGLYRWRRTSVAERLFDPDARVFLGVELHHFLEKCVLRGTIVRGQQLDRPGEALVAEIDVANFVRLQADRGIANDHEVARPRGRTP